MDRRSEPSTQCLMKPVDVSTDMNNNGSADDLEGKPSNESVPEMKHTKFCFSKDISEKEESLRSCNASLSSQDELGNRSSKEKKSVSFLNSFPVYLDINKGRKKHRFLDLPSDSESDVFGKNFGNLSSDIDLLSSPTESEMFDQLDKISEPKTEVISKAQTKLTHVLNKLQSMLLDVHGSDSVPRIKPSLIGEHNLLELVRLVSVVTDQLSTQYYNSFSTTSEIDKLARLQSSNNFLKEQLESQKNMKECLESEVKYLTKEKALLNEEVKHLTFQIATSSGKNMESSSEVPSKSSNPVSSTNPNKNTPKTEIFYRNPHQKFEPTDSNSSALLASKAGSTDGTLNNNASKPLENLTAKKELPSNEVTTPPICNCTEKLEHEFDSIVHSVYEKRNVMDNLQSQLRSYGEEIHGLQGMITTTHHEKQKILQDLEMLIEEQKTLLRERDHYESILKLILKEKTCSDFNLQDLLQNLIDKLNLMSSSPSACGNRTNSSLLEGALQAVQEQNSAQREEISQLKEKLSAERHANTSKVSNLEVANRKVSQQLETFAKELKAKDEEIKSVTDEAEKKYEKLQELHEAVAAAKNALETSICDKEDEVKSLKESLENLKKINVKQYKKIHDLHKTNVKLVKEIEELQQNMEQLGVIISQLRSNIKEQKGHWSERLRQSSEEASQSKEQCKWLQTQIEHLNQQLDVAHERVKAHENDKAQLAQQVLLAEEERKVVDRKLQELRTALEEDTVLREVLIERNEALQVEINRLRRSKLVSLAGYTERAILQENPPPMEMNQTADDPLSSIKALPPTDYWHVGEKHAVKKNRYTAAARRGNDVPRIAVSLHNGGLTQASSD